MRLAIDLRMTGWAFGGVAASQLVRRAAPWSLIGAIVTVVSGMALYSTDAARMAANPAFQIKLAALGLALANAWLFHAALGRRMRDWDLAGAAGRGAGVRVSVAGVVDRDPGRRQAHAVRLARLIPGGSIRSPD